MKMNKNEIKAATEFQGKLKAALEIRCNKAGIPDGQIKALRKYGKAFDVLLCCHVMLSSGYDANTMNSAGSSNKYTLKKACDLALFLAGNTARPDMYDLSAFESIFALANAGKSFTSIHLKSTWLRALAQYIPESDRAFLSNRHSCKDGTTGAQSSSTLTNFESYGIITRKAGTKDEYNVNLEAFATKLLASRLGLVESK